MKKKIKSEELKKISSFKSRSQLQKTAPGLYKYFNTQLSKKEQDSILPSKVPNYEKLTLSQVLKIASQYEYISHFQKHKIGVYKLAKRKKWLKEIKKSFKKTNKAGYWRKDNIAKEAKKYSTRMEFCSQSGGAYNAARRLQILDEVCNHMRTLGNITMRAIYIIEFEDNSAYIGLTHDYQERLEHHKKYTHLSQKLQSQRYRYRKLNIWLDLKQASLEEKKIITLYKANGWNILNKTLGGETGGNQVKWTYKKIIKVIKKNNIKYISEFRQLAPGGYASAKRQGFWEEIKDKHFKELKSTRYWTKKRIFEKARKYRFIEDFKLKEKAAYTAARRYDHLTEIKNILKCKIKKNNWLIEENVLKAAKSCKTRKEFCKRFPGAYSSAKKNNWFEQAVSHMPIFVRGNNRRHSKQSILRLAKKCKSYKEFREKYPGAYSASIQLGVRNEVKKTFPIYRPYKKYTKDYIRKEARRFNEVSIFKTKRAGVMREAQKLGIYADVTKHMSRKKKPNGYWTRERVFEVASKCSSLKEFRESYTAAFSASKKLKMTKEVSNYIKNKQERLAS